ncbi:tetratricopeptide repeat protein [Porticoccaceae bacterium LTM1]|nr:tetratricopeptide repeat protein [Porticoccaceae bacterium LTM1]
MSIKHLHFSALLLGITLGGCSSVPTSPIANTDKEDSSKSIQQTTDKPVEYPTRPFEAETLFDLLVAEVAGSRNEFSVALEKYTKQAFHTRDLNVVARATRISSYLNANANALKLSQLWVELDPEDLEARRLAAHYLTEFHQLPAALPHAIYMLEHGETDTLRTIAGYAALANNEQRQLLLDQYSTINEEWREHPDVLLTYATLLNQQGEYDPAQQTTNRLIELEPLNESARLLSCQIIEKQQGTDAALASLEKSLELLPNSKLLLLHSAKLWTDKDINRSRQQLSKLVTLFPDDHQLVYSLALISLQMGLEQDGEILLRRVLESPQLATPAHFQLAKLNERQGDTEQAILHYRNVRSGQYLITSASRLSRLLALENRMEEARIYLGELRNENPRESGYLFQVEAEMLENNGQPQNAFTVLSQALVQFPNAEPLLYARSLLSERTGNMAAAEQDLRTILKNTPDNPTALNALGYSLTINTNRYEEAHQLISRALELKPDDPATLDSLGWVLFKMGKHNQALPYLQKAFEKFPDPEVAAHLGEVLWALNRREEAASVWQQSLKDNPDSDIIISTMERLEVPEQLQAPQPTTTVK